VIGRLLEGAEKVIAGAQHCWLMTITQDGCRLNARPMGRVVASPAQSDWTLIFLSDARSKKVPDIQTAKQVRLTFVHSDDAFVSLAGLAEIVADVATIKRRWLDDYDRFFPTSSERANAVFVDIRLEEIRLWIRGLTPEPFGLRSLTLCRPPGGDWRLDRELD
jgi:general stress protein 26